MEILKLDVALFKLFLSKLLSVYLNARQRTSLSSENADRFPPCWRYPDGSHHRRIPKDHLPRRRVAVIDHAAALAGPSLDSRSQPGTDPTAAWIGANPGATLEPTKHAPTCSEASEEARPDWRQRKTSPTSSSSAPSGSGLRPRSLRGCSPFPASVCAGSRVAGSACPVA
jgi:hypothetical protein